MYRWIGLLIVAMFAFSGQMLADPREGIYIGAGVGASFDNSKLRAINSTSGFTVKRELEETHAIGSFFLGYGYTLCDYFFLGV